MDGEGEYDFYQPNLMDENRIGYRLNAQDRVIDIYHPEGEVGLKIIFV